MRPPSGNVVGMRPIRASAHDAAGEHTGDERGERHPGPGVHVGEVNHLELIRPTRSEVPRDVIWRPRRRPIRPGSDQLLAPRNAPQTLTSHQPLDRAAGHHDALPVLHMPHLARPADSTAKLGIPEHPLDLHDQLFVAKRSRCDGTRLESVVTRRGNLHRVLGEHSADWLDPEPVTMIVNELNHHGSHLVELPRQERGGRQQNLVGTLKLPVLRLGFLNARRPRWC
jgi:hypothetical protein